MQRGGGWSYSPVECHPGFRTHAGPRGRSDHRGFRVVRVSTKVPLATIGQSEPARAGTGAPALEYKTHTELNEAAWDLATSSDAAKRDGNRAVELASKACEKDSYRTPTFLDTLAAAYAEAGNFDAAVKWQMMAIEQNAPNGDNDEFRNRLGLYEAQEALPSGRRSLDCCEIGTEGRYFAAYACA